LLQIFLVNVAKVYYICLGILNQ